MNTKCMCTKYNFKSEYCSESESPRWRFVLSGCFFFIFFYPGCKSPSERSACISANASVLLPVTARSTVGPMVSVSQFELSGTGVVVVLKLSDVWVSVHGEADFLQVRGDLVVILGASGALLLLLLPAHFLIDWSMRLRFAMRPRTHLQHIVFGFF